MSESDIAMVWDRGHHDCHDLVCNTDRDRHPRGTKGVGCSCRGRDAAYQQATALRAALVGLVGVDGRAALTEMRAIFSPGGEFSGLTDAEASVAACDALLATMDESEAS